MTLTPLQLVATICAVIAAAVLGYLAAERLAKMLDGPRRGPALAGLVILNLIWGGVVAGLMLLSGHQGAPNFAILGLLPSLWTIRIADKPFPAAVRFGVVALGAALYLAILGVAAWTMRDLPRDEYVALLAAGLVAAIVAVAGAALYRIWLSVHERERSRT